MAWRQTLPDPIPQFDRKLQIAQDVTSSPPRIRKRGNHNGPVTWGQIKSLSFQAEQLRKEKHTYVNQSQVSVCMYQPISHRPTCGNACNIQ
uniref:Uncharacterized protein n=1 Tax=Podarcis muralis TaxID=64176 RepID=A0A670JL02_PODMU